MGDRIETARRCYEAYADDDRSVLEEALAAELEFFAPPDPGIDRVAYFERCWPNHENIVGFEFVRLKEVGDDEVLVTYEAERVDGSRFRNAEVMTFDGEGKVRRVEVYFGWDL